MILSSAINLKLKLKFEQGIGYQRPLKRMLGPAGAEHFLIPFLKSQSSTP